MRFLTTVSTAALIAIGVGAAAQNMTSEAEQYHRARDIIGNPIYTTNEYVEDWDLDAEVDDITMYDEIGEIEDLLIDESGEVVGLVAEVGGFLDIGDKHVMIRVDDLEVVRSQGEPYYVTRMTEEMLEDREGLDQGWWT
jgi:hypothetical protein